ncbi:MAG: DUF2254 domain-containing protein [Oligoflexus sp.]
MRLLTIFEYIKNSYWFLPGLMNLLALVFSLIIPSIERKLVSSGKLQFSWIYSGGEEGARVVMATIAGSMIGVAGVAFSVTIVTLVLASNQFGPRLIQNFMRDKGIQVVLGAFLATFLYCLMILRHVENSNSVDSFVPNFSVTFGVFLAIACLGLLIYFIHHVAESIQAPYVLARVSHELTLAINNLFPEELGKGILDDENIDQIRANLEAKFSKDAAEIEAQHSGYIQRIDLFDLMKIAKDKDLLVSIKHRPGQFIMKGDIAMLVHPKKALDEQTIKKLRVSFDVSIQKTLAQDVAFAIEQLVEVAVRALSPGVNDPFTAIQCIDWLGDGLTLLVNRKIPNPFQTDEEGQVRVIAYPVTFKRMVDASFNMIRQNSKNCPAVMFKTLDTIHSILCHTEHPGYRHILLEHATMVFHQARQMLETDHDLLDLEDRQIALNQFR